MWGVWVSLAYNYKYILLTSKKDKFSLQTNKFLKITVVLYQACCSWVKFLKKDSIIFTNLKSSYQSRK